MTPEIGQVVHPLGAPFDLGIVVYDGKRACILHPDGNVSSVVDGMIQTSRSLTPHKAGEFWVEWLCLGDKPRQADISRLRRRLRPRDPVTSRWTTDRRDPHHVYKAPSPCDGGCQRSRGGQ